MRQSPLIILALAFLALAGCGSRTQRQPSPYTENYRPPREEIFNGGPNAMLKYAGPDGSLTRAELAAGLKADFDKYDTKHNGCLDSDQVAAINAARIADDQATATPLQDWNQDGCIDLKEFSTAANSLFDQLDRNNDGTISPKEFNPSAPGAGANPAAAGQAGRRRGGGQGWWSRSCHRANNRDSDVGHFLWPRGFHSAEKCSKAAPFAYSWLWERRGGVAQLVRVSACHAEGRGFEPRRSRHFLWKWLVFAVPVARYAGYVRSGCLRVLASLGPGQPPAISPGNALS